MHVTDYGIEIGCTLNTYTFISLTNVRMWVYMTRAIVTVYLFGLINELLVSQQISTQLLLVSMIIEATFNLCQLS